MKLILKRLFGLFIFSLIVFSLSSVIITNKSDFTVESNEEIKLKNESSRWNENLSGGVTDVGPGYFSGYATQKVGSDEDPEIPGNWTLDVTVYRFNGTPVASEENIDATDITSQDGGGNYLLTWNYSFYSYVEPDSRYTIDLIAHDGESTSGSGSVYDTYEITTPPLYSVSTNFYTGLVEEVGYDYVIIKTNVDLYFVDGINPGNDDKMYQKMNISMNVKNGAGTIVAETQIKNEYVNTIKIEDLEPNRFYGGWTLNISYNDGDYVSETEEHVVEMPPINIRSEEDDSGFSTVVKYIDDFDSNSIQIGYNDVSFNLGVLSDSGADFSSFSFIFYEDNISNRFDYIIDNSVLPNEKNVYLDVKFKIINLKMNHNYSISLLINDNNGKKVYDKELFSIKTNDKYGWVMGLNIFLLILIILLIIGILITRYIWRKEVYRKLW